MRHNSTVSPKKNKPYQSPYSTKIAYHLYIKNNDYKKRPLSIPKHRTQLHINSKITQKTPLHQRTNSNNLMDQKMPSNFYLNQNSNEMNVKKLSSPSKTKSKSSFSNQRNILKLQNNNYEYNYSGTCSGNNSIVFFI